MNAIVRDDDQKKMEDRMRINEFSASLVKTIDCIISRSGFQNFPRNIRFILFEFKNCIQIYIRKYSAYFCQQSDSYELGIMFVGSSYHIQWRGLLPPRWQLSYRQCSVFADLNQHIGVPGTPKSMTP